MNFISFFWIINRFEFYLTVSKIPTSASTLDHNFIMKFSISTIRNVASDCACAAIFTFSSACVDAFTFTAWQICWAISIICARLFPFTFSKWVSGETLGITKKKQYFLWRIKIVQQSIPEIEGNWKFTKIQEWMQKLYHTIILNQLILFLFNINVVNEINRNAWKKSRVKKWKKMNRTEKYYAEKTIQKQY